MRKAIEESQKLEEEAKKKYSQEEDEEAEMIRQAIEMSQREEETRLKLEKEVQKLMTAPKEDNTSTQVSDVQPQADPIPP